MQQFPLDWRNRSDMVNVDYASIERRILASGTPDAYGTDGMGYDIKTAPTIDTTGDYMPLIAATICAVCVISAALAWLVLWASITPTVYESYSTGLCVEVYDPDGGHTCANLPSKYTHVWVK